MRQTLPLTLALLLLGAAAHAQESGRPQPQSFRIEWARLPPTMRPGVEGYVYNDSSWRVTNVRLRAQVRQLADRAHAAMGDFVVGESAAMQKVIDMVDKVAEAPDTTVLIQGVSRAEDRPRPG